MVPGIIHLFFTKLNGTVFEKYIRNERTNRYNIICSIYANNKQQTSSVDDGISSGGNELPPNSTTEALASQGANFDFIDCWIK